MKIKTNYTRQDIMLQEGIGAMTKTPSEIYGVIEIPDNSEIAKALRRDHPVVTAFEQKYLSRRINWRERLI